MLIGHPNIADFIDGSWNSVIISSGGGGGREEEMLILNTHGVSWSIWLWVQIEPQVHNIIICFVVVKLLIFKPSIK